MVYSTAHLFLDVARLDARAVLEKPICYQLKKCFGLNECTICFIIVKDNTKLRSDVCSDFIERSESYIKSMGPWGNISTL